MRREGRLPPDSEREGEGDEESEDAQQVASVPKQMLPLPVLKEVRRDAGWPGTVKDAYSSSPAPQACVEGRRWAQGISTLDWVGRRWQGLKQHPTGNDQSPMGSPKSLPTPPPLPHGTGLGSLVTFELLCPCPKAL